MVNNEAEVDAEEAGGESRQSCQDSAHSRSWPKIMDEDAQPVLARVAFPLFYNRHPKLLLLYSQTQYLSRTWYRLLLVWMNSGERRCTMISCGGDPR